MKLRQNLWVVHAMLIVFLFLSVVPVCAAIPDSERQALIYLYYGTGGNEWNRNTGWLGSAGTECDWYGVTCDAGAGSVIEIDLHSNNMVGALPFSLGDFQGLLFLDLSDNHLSGPIPSELGGLSSLQELYLTENQIDGSIPPELGELSKPIRA